MAKNDAERFSKELLDQLLAGRDPKTVFESGGLIGDLKKALAERMLNAEMDEHLANEAEAGLATTATAASAKTVLTDRRQARAVDSARPARSVRPAADRQVPRRFPGFDDKIIALTPAA